VEGFGDQTGEIYHCLNRIVGPAQVPVGAFRPHGNMETETRPWAFIFGFDPPATLSSPGYGFDPPATLSSPGYRGQARAYFAAYELPGFL
jgi:hypothetical protein